MPREEHIIQHGAYRLTADLLRTDDPNPMPLSLIPALGKGYKKAHQNSKSVQKYIEQLMAKHPRVPQFKDLLALHYSYKGEDEKARRLYGELLQDFPSYVYGRVELATALIEDKELARVPELLGPELSLAALYPQRRVFHYDEYAAFQKVLIDYYCALGEENRAGAILDDLEEVADRLQVEDDFRSEEDRLLLSRLVHLKDNAPGSTRNDHLERSEPTLPQTQELPVFRLPQTALLYQHGFSTIPDQVIHDLLAADRELLRLDLEDVVRDAIHRFQYFYDRDFDYDTHSAPVHALFLLKEIKAEESLPVVLELLRQPESVLEFWLSDLLTEDTWQVLYALGFHQLPQLTAFLKEPMNHTYARTAVSAALQQVALHHPERRAEVLALYKDLLAFYVAHAGDPAILDPVVVAFVATDAADLHATELLPDIKAAFDAGIVDRSVGGSFADLQKLMHSKEERKWPLQDYSQIKQELARFEKEQPATEEWKEKKDFYMNWEKEQEDVYADWQEEDDEESRYFHTGHDPYVREEPKIGRNDPCYCGSGKKYKHCHGKS